MFSVAGHYGTLPSTKTMGNISEHAMTHSIPTSPSHGSLALYSTFSPPRQQVAPNPNSPHSEVSSPVYRGDGTLDHRQKAHLAKVAGIAPDKVIMIHFCLQTVCFTRDKEYKRGVKWWHRATESPVYDMQFMSLCTRYHLFCNGENAVHR